MSLEIILKQLSQGMVTSIEIFILTLIFSIPLGMIVALGRLSKVKLLNIFVRIYISIMRGTPLMLQLLVVYFGPYYLFKISIGNNYRMYAVIIAFVLNYAAYFGEIYRGGIESIPKGQHEAAKVLGYSRVQTFIKIILPQVIKRVIPAVTNEVITLIKDTSLAFSIAVSEMFTVAKAIAASEKTMVSFAAAGLFYYVFNFIVAVIMEAIEKKLNYYK
ncbi:MAG: amino acid ABC transporter permease [Clostridiaceae bacterium]